MNRKSGNSGFTLIELVVVMFVISLAAALLFPRLPSSESTDLRMSADSVATLFRMIDQEACAGKKLYRLNFNPSIEKLEILEEKNGLFDKPSDPRLNRTVLKEGVTLDDIRTPSTGSVSSGEVSIDIGAGGISDFITVHLGSLTGSLKYTVMAFPSTGKVKVFEGYQETPL